jgi:hypothetical protein
VRRLSGRAYTPEQKRAMMERLLSAWERYPYLRLGQFLANVADNHDLFYVEDEDLTAACETWHP